MPSNLGSRRSVGVLGTLVGPDVNQVVSGAWVVRFPTQILPSDSDFEVYHATVRGPGGHFFVFLDDKQYGVGLNGRMAEFAGNPAMYVLKGQEIIFYWTIATTPAPQVVIWLRQPEVGRL